MSNNNNSPLKSKRPLRSLQSQYIYAALLLGSLVIIGTVIGYSNIITTSSNLLTKAKKTSTVLSLTTDIRKHTNLAYSSVLSFMLDPDKTEQRNLIQSNLDRSESILDSISQEVLIKQLGLQSDTQHLQQYFKTLRKELLHLLSVRTTANKQYPALAIASEVMLPLRNEIFTALNISLIEYREDAQLNLNTMEYALLNESLLTWIATLAEYRLYLTNRMGSYDSVQLLEQEASVDDHVLLMKKLATRLNKFKREGRLGFQSSNLVGQLPDLLSKWHAAFHEVKAINHSGHWRNDSTILKSNIDPLMQSINQHLNFIDAKVKFEYQSILEHQTSASTQHNYILAGITILFLTYIIISIKLLKHFIIRPIATMATAMKDEAYHHTGLHSLDLNRTKETQDLIDAFSEMSHQVFKRQDELEFQAMHDSLTGLPNRLMLHQRLDYHLLIAERESNNLIFMMLDLNRFKEINDTLGHHVGDSLLVEVGERIHQLLRGVDTVARLGGDEFAVLLPSTNKEQASHVAKNINTVLEDPFHLNDYELQISGSIGIAEYPADGQDTHTLMQHADVAMYIAKKEKSGFHYYSASEDSHSVGRLSLGGDLKNAIETEQLELYFQPKYHMDSGNLVGCEALLRWQHPENGSISPEVIIDVAEEMGIINELSHWVIRNAFNFCSESSKLHHEFTMAINLSVQNLKDPLLVDHIRDLLHKENLSSSQITFEITESAMMSNPEKSIQVLNKLSQLGVRLAVDDFGTGFSSLAYLKILPVNELKIDKSFVMDMVQDDSDRLIVHSTIELSHNLGLEVTAEGVECQRCWEMLNAMGCNHAQGYYKSRPLNKTDFIQILEDSMTITTSVTNPN